MAHADSITGIQSLSPDAPPPAGKSIRAKISLIWPYSSSTGQCALLLAEPDVRLRRHRGQVRVRFTGASAAAVAEAKVGIDDELVLELRGATWAAEVSTVNAPGRSVGGELVFRGELGLRIVRKHGRSEHVDQSVCVNASTPPREEEALAPRNETPATSRAVLGRAGVDLTPIYSSPAFVKRQRLSGGGGLFFQRGERVSGSLADVERELEEDERRPRKKTQQRISDVRDWRFTARTPSPEKTPPAEQEEADMAQRNDVGVDEMAQPVEDAPAKQSPVNDASLVCKETAWSPAARQTVARAEQTAPSASPTEIVDAQMSAEPTLLGLASQAQPDASKPENPPTPELRPVPACGLPLPSPFPIEAQQSPFGGAHGADPAPTEYELRRRPQTLEPSRKSTQASPSDDSAVLQVEPATAAPAPQSQQLQAGQPSITGDSIDASLSTDTAAFPAAFGQASRHRAQHSIDSKTAATPDAEVRVDADDEQHEYTRASEIHDQAQSQHPQYLSDTEEDEDLEQLYSQAAQRAAGQRRLREGVKERDFALEGLGASFAADAENSAVPQDRDEREGIVHEDEAEQVILDTGEKPEEDSDDDPECAGDDHGPDTQSACESPIAEAESDATQSALEIMADMGTRSVAIPTDIVRSEDEEDDSLVTEAPEPQKTDVSVQSEKSPETPAPLISRGFGLGFGFDGTSSPPVSRTTPQSQKERTMKKTYGSLFGFRVSPSPEREIPVQQQQPQPQPQQAEVVESNFPSQTQKQKTAETPTPFGAVTRESLEAHPPRPSANTKDQLLKRNEVTPNAALDGASIRKDMPVDEPAENGKSPPRDAGDYTLHNPHLDAVLSHTFDHVTPLEPKQPRVTGAEGSRDTVAHNHEFLGVKAERLRQDQAGTEDEPRHQENPSIERPQQAGPPPSSAPVRSFGTDKIELPPSSTAPGSSQVEVIGLGAIHDEDAEETAQHQPLHHDPAITQDGRDGEDDVVSLSEPAEGNIQVTTTPEVGQVPEQAAIELMVGVEPASEDIAELEAFSPAGPVAADMPESQVRPEVQSESFAEQMPDEHVQPLESPMVEQSQEAAIPASQLSNKCIADRYHYFSFQSASAPSPSLAADEDQDVSSSPRQHDAAMSLSRQNMADDTPMPDIREPTAQSEAIEMEEAQLGGDMIDDVQLTGTGSGVEVQESSGCEPQDEIETEETLISRIVDSSKQVGALENAPASASQRLTRARAQRLTQSSTSAPDLPHMQVAASSFVEDNHGESTEQSKDHRRPHSELPVPPEKSQLLGAQEPFTSFIPPTPEVTSDGLKVVVEEAQGSEARQNTTKRTRRRAGSAANKTPVRRSQRKSLAPSQPEEAGDTTIQVAAEEPASAPDTTHHRPSLTASVENHLLNPTTQTTARRSPRQSAGRVEATEKTADREPSPQAPPPKKAATRKSSRKTLDGSEFKGEMKLSNEDVADDGIPPPKRTALSKKQTPDKTTSAEEPLQEKQEQAKSTPAMTPIRRSFTSRLGQVPEVVSAWFSPRRSTRQQAEEKRGQSPIAEKRGLPQHTSFSGITTTKSYYSPLANIEEKLNQSSQAGFDNTVDIIAVVTDASSTPERAQSGAKDFFTVFKITDPSLTSKDNADALGETRVDVYRHWHATLPVAQPGDVVLLRGFAVKSRTRRPYLLSGEASAWLVWRFSEAGSPDGRTRHRPGSSSGAREEVKGPPVEFAEAERQRARQLRQWWLARQRELAEHQHASQRNP